MTARELFQAGKVREAEKQLTAYVRVHPTDIAQRTFLFELLCFAGEYRRAEKQLSVLAHGGLDAEMGAVLYYAALHAEKTRHEMFEKSDLPLGEELPCPGKFNGQPFESIRDADPEIGSRLEVYAAGAYLWIPFGHIASVEIDPPRKLRDTLWTPALVKTGPSFHGTDLGEVLIPVIYPFSWRNPDESLWLGHLTEWFADDDGKEYPSGQKMFLIDGEEVPLLDVRSLEFFGGQETVPETKN